MAAPKGQSELNKLFDEIITDISENGKSIRDAIKERMSSSTFYELLNDENKLKRYARATEIRSDKMAEDILEIADNQEDDVYINADGIEVTNHNVINRSRLRVDARKWILAKMNPKKYGDKTDITSGNEPIKQSLNITVDTSDTAETLKKLRNGT